MKVVDRDPKITFIRPARQQEKKFRPNFKRQILYAGIALASVLVGYYLVRQMAPPAKPDTVKSTPTEAAKPQAWYKQQKPPPSLVTLPDEPLFPEPEDVQPAQQKLKIITVKRAYEEALPKEIYEPVVVRAPNRAIDKPEPVIGPTSGMPLWRQYAVPYVNSGDGPMVAIVIDDMGVDQTRTAKTIDLPAPLTLSFLTYARDLNRQTGQARANGHELMLHVAMEPTSSTVDPGPNVLLTDLDDEELLRRLDWGFSRFTGYVGINNHMGSKFTSDTRAMQVVINAVRQRGLLFLDSRTSAHTVGAKLARQSGVPMVERNIFIDHVNKLDDVNARLADVEKFARRNGYAVAIGHPRQVTIEALKVWLADIQAKGFRLVPISTIVKKFGTS